MMEIISAIAKITRKLKVTRKKHDWEMGLTVNERERRNDCYGAGQAGVPQV